MSFRRKPESSTNKSSRLRLPPAPSKGRKADLVHTHESNMDFNKVEQEFSRSKTYFTEASLKEIYLFRELLIQTAKDEHDLIKFIISLSVTLTGAAFAISQTSFFKFSPKILGSSIFFFSLAIVLGVWMLKVRIQRDNRILPLEANNTYKKLAKKISLCSEIISAAWEKNAEVINKKMEELSPRSEVEELVDATHIGEEKILHCHNHFFGLFILGVIALITSLSWNKLVNVFIHPFK